MEHLERHLGRFLSTFAILWLIAGHPVWAADGRPNIVLFLVDDLGWADTEPYGSQYYRTPAVQQLAQQGMRFTDAYASPLCSPTRASLLTGQSPLRHGILTADGHRPPLPAGFEYRPEHADAGKAWLMPVSKRVLEPAEITLAEALAAAGYRTGHFGKWHLGLTAPYWPEQQGFQVAVHGAPDPGIPSYFAPYRFKRYQSFPDGPRGEYITDRLTDEAIAFMRANRDQPFFVNLWHYAVHGPWGHKSAYTQVWRGRIDPAGLQGNPIMGSMIQSVDESLARVLAAIDELGIADHTIVIFYSDNGGNVHSNVPTQAWLEKMARLPVRGERRRQWDDWQYWAKGLPPTNNAPLRDGKGTLYEGGVRVPLIIRWPGHVPAHAISHEVVGAIDIYPTVLDLLGLPVPAGQVVDGISLRPVLSGQGSLQRDAFFNYAPLRSDVGEGGVSVRAGDWKLIRWFAANPVSQPAYSLYNLKNDIGETRDLASEMPGKVQALNRLIDGFLSQAGASPFIPVPNPAYRAPVHDKPDRVTGNNQQQ